jgi:hypothetical protein
LSGPAPRPGAAGPALRLALAAGALLAAAWPAQPGGAPTVHPLVPPLTRVDGLGDHTLGPPAPPPPPTGAPAPGVAGLRARAREGRVAVEATAQALAAALGPARVEAALQQREALSAAVGEGAVWTALEAALAAPPAGP